MPVTGLRSVASASYHPLWVITVSTHANQTAHIYLPLCHLPTRQHQDIHILYFRLMFVFRKIWHSL